MLGSWGQWGPWGQCSMTCGDQGTRERNRRCLKRGNSASVDQCSGNGDDDAKEMKNCILPQCPGDLLTFLQSQKFIINTVKEFIYLLKFQSAVIICGMSASVLAGRRSTAAVLYRGQNGHPP